MATQTRSVSGQVITYTITDEAGSSVAVAVSNATPGGGTTTTFTSSGGLHADGMQMLATLQWLLATGAQP